MNIFEAAEYAESLSECNKRPVGAAIELNNHVVSIGWNHGVNEVCSCDKHKTNPNVLHAEVVAFFAEDDFCFTGGAIAITYLPCIDCAKLIHKKGISRVYYRDHRHDKQDGIDYLKNNGVEVKNEWQFKYQSSDCA